MRFISNRNIHMWYTMVSSCSCIPHGKCRRLIKFTTISPQNGHNKTSSTCLELWYLIGKGKSKRNTEEGFLDIQNQSHVKQYIDAEWWSIIKIVQKSYQDYFKTSAKFIWTYRLIWAQISIYYKKLRTADGINHFDKLTRRLVGNKIQLINNTCDIFI